MHWPDNDGSSEMLKASIVGLLALWFLAEIIRVPALAVDLPDIGDSAGRAISPEAERRLGEAFMRDLRQHVEIVDDPEVEAYIQSVGYRLVSHSADNTQQFTFFVVKDPIINAFAAPGGYIGINSGVVLRSTNESELAAVMAHEVSHVTQRHLARAFEQANQFTLPVAAAMIGAILLGAVYPELGQAAMAGISAGNIQAQINFTRANEEEADRVGMDLLVRSSYDPQGMPGFFERLQQASRYYGGQPPEFLSTHPVTVSRIADSRNRAAQYPYKQYPDSVSYRLVRAKLRVITEEKPGQAVKYFEEQLKTGQFIDENAARYGYALALMANNEHEKAGQQLEELLQSDRENVAYLLAAARLEISEEHYESALAIYAGSLKLYPDYRPLILGYAEALILAGRPAEAKSVLRNYARQHPLDPAYYRLLAEAEGRSGAEVDARMSMGEYYYLVGQTAFAIEQLKRAQSMPAADHYQKERIDARLKQLEEEQELERQFKL
ncbi:MAG: M48 family metalloprotease [Gammaproteobacteria bacterium]|nr:M48 family metalloprotease [Gammaproteobacteria bacterium]MCI0590768.1 M48 family metalloprotease [Gammaproteobacteria bacterium]